MLVKNTFILPLSDKEKTPHKIGNLNKAKVQAALPEIMKGYKVTLVACIFATRFMRVIMKNVTIDFMTYKIQRTLTTSYMC
jgi:hypothetical protein